jgi:hypothetical protein
MYAWILSCSREVGIPRKGATEIVGCDLELVNGRQHGVMGGWLILLLFASAIQGFSENNI